MYVYVEYKSLVKNFFFLKRGGTKEEKRKKRRGERKRGIEDREILYFI